VNWFLLSLPEPEAAVPEAALPWARVSAAGRVVDRGRAPLAQAARQLAAGDRVLVLVPGERVLLHHVAIPARSRRAQLQALPFALEDRLSEDLEALHIVPGPRRADGQLLAAVAAHRDMETWLGWLRETGVTAHALFPDTALLPSVSGRGLRVHCTPERCLAVVPGGEPVALAAELLPWWLNQWLGRREPGTPIEWHGPRELLPASIRDDPGLEAQDWDGDLLTLLAPALARRPGLNLLYGPYAEAGSGAASLARWRVPAAIAAALALLWTGSLWLEVRQLEREVQRIDSAIADLFEATLPNTRLIDPAGQFRQILEAGSAVTPSGAGALSARLARAAPVLAEARVELQQLRADEDRLELEFDLGSITELDSLRTRLREASGGEVRILAAESGEAGVRARLQIEGGGS
jgi:general secretion pathway protein L